MGFLSPPSGLLKLAVKCLVVGAALNVPSAIAMISTSFPDHKERSRAYAVYGAFGAIGNCLGFIIGGVISARTSWRWGEHLRTPF